MHVSRYLYTFCLYLCLPIIFVRLVWRSFKNSEYRRRWLERLAFYNKSISADRQLAIVIHAVSVGEVHGAIPLIRTLIAHHPDLQVIVTTSTPTGSARVRELLKNSVTHVYLPYDLPGAMQRFLTRFSPSIFVLMETELWPNRKNMARWLYYSSQLFTKNYRGVCQ